MTIQYLTNIKETNKTKTLLLIEASLQAYHAFDEKHPTTCQNDKIISPIGYDFVECWSGVDSLFSRDKTVEIFGAVFRSTTAPYTYIFAFRGTTSILDILDDLGAEQTNFTTYAPEVDIPSGVKVESGFFDVYSTSDGSTPSMQDQLFQLIDKYGSSNQPIHELFITGHSLGSALCELFTLDIALSRPGYCCIHHQLCLPSIG